MSKPTFKWEGAVESAFGTATYIVGDLEECVSLPLFYTAARIQKLIDTAYSEGQKDGKLKLMEAMKNDK